MDKVLKKIIDDFEPSFYKEKDPLSHISLEEKMKIFNYGQLENYIDYDVFIKKHATIKVWVTNSGNMGLYWCPRKETWVKCDSIFGCFQKGSKNVENVVKHTINTALSANTVWRHVKVKFEKKNIEFYPHVYFDYSPYTRWTNCIDRKKF